MSGAVQNVIIFVAVLLIPVGTVGSLYHAANVIFTILAVIILRLESVTRRKIILTFLTLVGIILTLISAVRNMRAAKTSIIKDDKDSQDTLECPRKNTSESNFNFSQSWTGSLNQLVTSNFNGSIHSSKTGFSPSSNEDPSFWTSQLFGIILALSAGLHSFESREALFLFCWPKVLGQQFFAPTI